jgi:DNA-binding NarL/FixJ family response regulator
MAITVFVADDHAVMREGLSQLLLAQQGTFEVVGTAASGLETVRDVIRLKPQVVILDISMPGMNGLEAARQIREGAPGTHVVMLTMHSTSEHVFHALEAGARAYILKESAGREIIAAIRTVLAGRRFVSPEVAGIVTEHLALGRRSSPIDSLSDRERQILQLVAEGHSSIRIATRLNISPKTVDTYRSRLMQKLNLPEVTALVKFAIQHGITTLE